MKNMNKDNKELAKLTDKQLSKLERTQKNIPKSEKLISKLENYDKCNIKLQNLKIEYDKVLSENNEYKRYAELYNNLINEYNELVKERNKLTRYKNMFGQLESLNVHCPDLNKEIHLYDCNRSYNNKLCNQYSDCSERKELIDRIGRLPFG